MRGIESMDRASRKKAENPGATARRLLAELRPYKGGLVLALVLVVVGAATQAGGPYLIGRAIDENTLGGDHAELLRTMALLFGVYVVGALASRGQIRQVGTIGQSVLASLRARIFGKI